MHAGDLANAASTVQPAPNSINALLPQLALALADHLDGLPQFARDLAVMDLVRNGVEPLPDAQILSFTQVYRKLTDLKVLGICGGSKLEASTHPNKRIYAFLNHHLGRALADCDWSVCSGGGPGKAMKGLQYCLKEATTPERVNLSISVLSGLNDENPHPYADLLVRSPGDIAIREKMIIGLSKVVVVYPGNIGTYAEIFEMMMQNYVNGRGSYSTEPPKFILVSYNDENLSGGHYFAPIVELLNNACLAGLSKGENMDWMKLIRLPNPDQVSTLHWAGRDEIFCDFAKQIVEIAETAWADRAAALKTSALIA